MSDQAQSLCFECGHRGGHFLTCSRAPVTGMSDWLGTNSPISDRRPDLGGETQCPARERDGSRCNAPAELFTFAHLCRRHHAMIARGAKVVLVNGTRLDRIWSKATRQGLYE
jgi:hypothetical protein